MHVLHIYFEYLNKTEKSYQKKKNKTTKKYEKIHCPQVILLSHRLIPSRSHYCWIQIDHFSL